MVWIWQPVYDQRGPPPPQPTLHAAAAADDDESRAQDSFLDSFTLDKLLMGT